MEILYVNIYRVLERTQTTVVNISRVIKTNQRVKWKNFSVEKNLTLNSLEEQLISQVILLSVNQKKSKRKKKKLNIAKPKDTMTINSKDNVNLKNKESEKL